MRSHKDRHEKIGEGYIGLEALVRIINHPLLREIPFYLETPNDDQGYQQEIALLKSHYQKKIIKLNAQCNKNKKSSCEKIMTTQYVAYGEKEIP